MRAPVIAAAVLLLGTPPAPAQPLLPWQQACRAIEPAVPCTAANRVAIEDAMRRCREAEDQPACHRRQLTRQRQTPARPPTVFRGARER